MRHPRGSGSAAKTTAGWTGAAAMAGWHVGQMSRAAAPGWMGMIGSSSQLQQQVQGQMRRACQGGCDVQQSDSIHDGAQALGCSMINTRAFKRGRQLLGLPSCSKGLQGVYMRPRHRGHSLAELNHVVLGVVEEELRPCNIVGYQSGVLKQSQHPAWSVAHEGLGRATASNRQPVSTLSRSPDAVQPRPHPLWV